MPKSALPPHLDTPEEWKGTDWDTWYQRWMLTIKHWFAYGPRAKEWWAKWREYPILLAGYFAGDCRQETRDGSAETRYGTGFMTDLKPSLWKRRNYVPKDPKRRYYVSPIQYWCKWHIQIQWPFFFAFHYTFGRVPKFPKRPNNKHKVLYFRIGARRDSDRVYWFPSLFIGLDFN